MWTSCAAFSLTRISVQRNAWTSAKPITNHRLVLGSVAREAIHAAIRRIVSLRLCAPRGGKNGDGRHGLCLRHAPEKWQADFRGDHA